MGEEEWELTRRSYSVYSFFIIYMWFHVLHVSEFDHESATSISRLTNHQKSQCVLVFNVEGCDIPGFVVEKAIRPRAIVEGDNVDLFH